MSKVSYTCGNVINYPMWLIFSRNGDVRLTRREPGQLSRDERALRLDATLPLSLWEIPVLHASLNIESPEAGASINLDLTAAGEALKGALGLDIDLQVREPGT